MTQTDNHNHADVIVIGAGLSGLTAARRLYEAGKNLIVLEARDRVKTYSDAELAQGRRQGIHRNHEEWGYD